MSTHYRSSLAATSAALILAFSACSGSAGSSGYSGQSVTPSVTTALATIPIAGEYKGRVIDNKEGDAVAGMQLAQNGTTLGGSMTQSFKTKTVHAVISFSSSAGSLRGSEVALGKTPCTFAVTAAYDAKDATLAGKYTATNNCTGRSGTFKFTQQCYYITPSASADIERPDNLVLKPC